ncbi:MAG: type II CAAX prenyl endopeptidase Rce1 family protein [Oligosphaeraceae bacterium]
MTPSLLPLLLMLAGALAGRAALFLPHPALRLLLPSLAALAGMVLGLRLAGVRSPLPLLLASRRPVPSGKRRLLLFLGWTPPLFLLLQGLQLLLGKLFPPAADALPPVLTPALLLSSCLLAPCAEELLYRRLLPDALAARGFPRFAGHLLSALLFALAHGNPRVLPGLFLLGLALGALREREDTLQAILVHGGFNALTLLTLALLPSP